MEQFTLGPRLQLEDVTGNRIMRRVIIGSPMWTWIYTFKRRCVLIINTAMGELGKLGDAFGQFIMMHFSRPYSGVKALKEPKLRMFFI